MLHESPSPASVLPESPTTWIWHGLIAPGCITVLSGDGRVGKSRFVRAVVGHRRRGQPFLGLAVSRGTSIVASEEHARFWEWQLKYARIDGSAMYHIEAHPGVPPSEADFERLLRIAVAARQSHGVDLFVFDPLSRFVPDLGDAPLDSIADRLRPITDAGVAVLLVDPPRPMIPAPFADIHLELRRVSLTNPSTGRRRLIAHRGFAETPASLRFAMDYHWSTGRLLSERSRPDDPPYWPTLKQLLEQSPGKRTRNELHAQWPNAAQRPSKITLWRWLEAAWAQGQLDREGMGTTKEPYRYGLAGAASAEPRSAPVA